MKTREIVQLGYKLKVDRSSQVLRIDTPETVITYAKLGDAKPLATLPDPGGQRFLSAAVLLQKCKQVDDGLYAAVEIMSQNGAGLFAGKVAWLQEMCNLLQSCNQVEQDAAATVFSASRLAGIETNIPAEIVNLVQDKLSLFESAELESKPISFYTWTAELGQIFKQDRFLQQPVDRGSVAKIAKVMRSNLAVRDTYLTYMDLIAKLTNPADALNFSPLVIGSGEPDARQRYYLIPPSMTPETRLLKELFGPDKTPPSHFSLIDEVVKRVQSRKLNLAPGSQSGWYDYVLWAIEPLVIPDLLPESSKLIAGPQYKKALLELFKGAYALSRETHTKLAPGYFLGLAAPKLTVSPELTIEPLPSVYFRRAAGYRFIKEVLVCTFGEEALAQVTSIREDRALTISLLEELTWMENLFLGAHATACDELGLDTFDCGADVDLDFARTTLSRWIQSLSSDSDVSRDSRMMVPVFYDEQTKRTKCWVFLGWVEKTLHVNFQKNPTVSIDGMESEDYACNLSAGGTEHIPQVVFQEESYKAYYPFSAEVYVERLMDRSEFRQFCSRHADTEAILAGLEGEGAKSDQKRVQGKRPWWQFW